MTGKITDAASRHEEGLLENAMLTDSVEDRTNYMKEPSAYKKGITVAHRGDDDEPEPLEGNTRGRNNAERYGG
ncbi:unnamed protein product, partial [Mesorhabditis belari]|uniref:Uncharacterized protein n=1 Tax=Mesorhabditis belari TaxID=2138241 RepID=A0AAF3FHM6_9BILA